MDVVIAKQKMEKENTKVSTNEALFSQPEMPVGTLRDYVLNSIEHYFHTIRSNQGAGLQTLVNEEVESAMYEAAMKFTKGNQVQAAKVLGVARGTLRTKLKQYFGTTQVGGLYHKYEVKALTKVDAFVY
jgi:Fis family transcriptional regulator